VFRSRTSSRPRTFVPQLEELEDRTVFSVSAIGGFNPASATWYLRTTPGPGNPDGGQFQYGPAGSIPVVGDWNGDGKQDIGVVDPRTMTWYLHYGVGPGNPDAALFRFGGAGSIPVVGDWNGDGITDIGVVDPATMTWYLHFYATPGNPDAGVFRYGGAGSTPVVGHWTGGSKDGIGVVTHDLTWLLRPTATPGNPDTAVFQYGGVGWKPVVGDWNGDGIDGIGAVAPNLTWYLHSTATPGNPDAGVFQYGGAGATPVTGAFPPGNVSAPTGAFVITLRFASALTPSQQSIVKSAAARWEQVIVGALPPATYQGLPVSGVLIDVTAAAIDGPGNELASSGPDAFRNGSGLPIHGTMTFDSADLASMQAQGLLFSVALHEMAHVFGFGTIWQTLGLLSGAGTADPEFTGGQATAQYDAIFGSKAHSVPVEGSPAPPGSADGHWRQSVFGDELMTPAFTGNVHPLSRVTVASLADLGYVVNLAAADAYVAGQ
jgi:hypothetical protein